MRRPGLSNVPTGLTPHHAQFLQNVKTNMEILLGQRGARIEPLGASATTTEIIDKINELIELLQG